MCVCGMVISEFLGLVVFVRPHHFVFFRSFCLWTPHFFSIAVAVVVGGIAVVSQNLLFECVMLMIKHVVFVVGVCLLFA